jgi:hypothetical protein
LPIYWSANTGCGTRLYEMRSMRVKKKTRKSLEWSVQALKGYSVKALEPLRFLNASTLLTDGLFHKFYKS